MGLIKDKLANENPQIDVYAAAQKYEVDKEKRKLLITISFLLDHDFFTNIYDFKSFSKEIDSLSKESVSFLEDKIIATGDGLLIGEFAQTTEKVNIKRLEDVIIDLGEGFDKIAEAKGANFKKLLDAVIASHNATEIYIFAGLPKCTSKDIERLQEELIKLGDAECLFDFASDVEGADINKLQDALIKTRDAHYIFYFARNIDGVDIKKLQKAIISTKNAEYIKFFADEIEGADKDKLMKVYEELKGTNVGI